MGNQKKPMQDALPWLLEKDSENPGVRYFALTELLGHPSGETEASQAQAALMTDRTCPGYPGCPGPGRVSGSNRAPVITQNTGAPCGR